MLALTKIRFLNSINQNFGQKANHASCSLSHFVFSKHFPYVSKYVMRQPGKGKHQT